MGMRGSTIQTLRSVFTHKTLLKQRHPVAINQLRRISIGKNAQTTAEKEKEHIRIVEVGPRDGLQNEKQKISVDLKVDLVNRLVGSGLTVVEAASFVSPKWVPQMEGSDQVIKKLGNKQGVTYTALVPNDKGLEKAIESGVKEIAIFGAASEKFSQKNINCSIDESLNRFRTVTEKAIKNGIKIRGYVSCVLGCPYQGEVTPQVVADVSAKMMDLGCYEISLGDTIGVGTPERTQNLLNEVSKKVPMSQLAVHFHDTYGQAIANIYASVNMGVRVVDSSVAGLGGCPYAKGASGNVATEDVVYLLEGLGFSTGIDLDELVKTGVWISKELGRPYLSKAGQAVFAKLGPQPFYYTKWPSI